MSFQRIGAAAVVAFREGVRSRLLWTALLFAVAALVLPSTVHGVEPAERSQALLVTLYRAAQAILVASALLLCALPLPRQIAGKTFHTLLTKPVRAWEYLCGTVLGTLGVLAAVQLVFWGIGALALARSERANGRSELKQAFAQAPLSLGGKAGTGQCVFRLEKTLPAGLGVELPLTPDAFQDTDLALTIRAAGKEETRAARLEARTRSLWVPLPDAARQAGSEIVVAYRPAGADSVPAVPSARSARLARSGPYLQRQWGLAVLSLAPDLALLSAITFFLSTFCAWPLALVAAFTLFLAGNALEFLREFPKTLEQQALQQIFSPTIYHTHDHAQDHGHAHDHGHRHEHGSAEAPDEGEGTLLDGLRRASEKILPAFCAVYPDLARYPAGERIERRLLLDPAELAGYGGYLGLYVAALVAAGGAVLARKDYP